MSIPADFLWGAATAAYQIEGATTEDGKGLSIWDTFAHTPGAIERGETGDIACDHYHRWREDVDLMAQLGLRAYRFSISWPRVLPTGRGTVNQAGLDFYDRLVDALLARSIIPFVTLYHWDLPQALEDAGGWLARDTASALADYAEVVTRRLGDRVKYWVTINEPFSTAYLGYVGGEFGAGEGYTHLRHAPGLRGFENFAPVMHHQLLAHGLALQVLRSNAPGSQAGIAFNIAAVEPENGDPANEPVAQIADAFLNTSALDPVLKGHYPDLLQFFFGPDLVKDGDLALIGAPTDYIGVNYYTRVLIRATPDNPIPGFENAPPATTDLTDMGWEIYPQGLAARLRRLHADYPGHDIYITESGAAFPDVLDPDGHVHDERRTTYLREHIKAVLATRDEGVPVKGYLVWALLDNFEWSLGYRPRFGLIYADYPTQQRYIKDSGHWLARLIASGDLDA
jgi:beta-glucosidase